MCAMRGAVHRQWKRSKREWAFGGESDEVKQDELRRDRMKDDAWCQEA